MAALKFCLNLPWTILGLLAGIISLPVKLRLNQRPFAILIYVRSFWWCSWFKGKGLRATTSGNVVLLGPSSDENDEAHELIHVEQYQKIPLIFPLLYHRESIKCGYRHNKYELEAYRVAGNKYEDS